MPITIDLLVEHLQTAFVVLDRDLKITQMNGHAETLLRRDRGKALGRTLDEIIPDAAQSQHWPAFKDLLASGRTDNISIFYPTQYRWHDVTVIGLPEGGAVLLMRDVTDRQWLIRREAEKVYLKNVFEDAPVGITVMRGKTLVFEYVNQFARKLIGGRRIEGLALREAFPDLEQRELFDVIENVYRSGKPYHGRDVLAQFDRNGDGKIEDGYFDVSYQPVRDFDGTVSGILNISVEVTDRTRDRASR